MKKFLAATLALALSAALQSGLAVGTPTGTTITNTGYLDLNDGVTTSTITSTPVVVNVTQVYGITIKPDGTTAAPGQTITLFPGQTGVLTYDLTNTGNGTDSFNVAAAVANATAQGANILGVYLDNTTTGTGGSYDAGDTLVTSVANLAADATRRLFIRYSLPSGTTGGSASGAAHQLNITGTSVGDTTQTDTNNVGQFTVGRVIDMTLTSTQTKTVTPSGSITFTDTLTNTGNTTLSAADITATVSAAATNGAGTSITNNFTTTYTVGGNTGSDLEALINTAVAGGLAAGGTLTITVNVTAPGTPTDLDKQALTILTYSATTGTGVQNNAPITDTAQGQIVNTAVVARGVGSVTKKLALCGSSVSACPARTDAAVGTAAISAKPGEYVVYYLEATNTGTGTLTNVRLRDALPADFVVTHVGATTTGAGTLKFSTNGTTWATTPAGLTLTGGTTLYVSVENGGTATTIDTSDTFPAASTLRVRIAGYVRSEATTPSPTITRDETGL